MTTTRMQLFVAALSIIGGCRYGGPSADPRALVEPLSDATVDATSSLSTEDDPFDDDAGDVASLATSDAGDTTAVVDAGGSDFFAESDAGVSATLDECAPQIRGCDPVKKTGCVDLVSVCVVDPDAASSAGHCVFPSQPPAMGCEENTLYASCLAGSGCYDNTCRTFCFCDAECGAGECCVDPAEKRSNGLIKLCGACP